jgi:hypothetical protein
MSILLRRGFWSYTHSRNFPTICNRSGNALKTLKTPCLFSPLQCIPFINSPETFPVRAKMSILLRRGFWSCSQSRNFSTARSPSMTGINRSIRTKSKRGGNSSSSPNSAREKGSSGLPRMASRASFPLQVTVTSHCKKSVQVSLGLTRVSTNLSFPQWGRLRQMASRASFPLQVTVTSHCQGKRT